MEDLRWLLRVASSHFQGHDVRAVEGSWFRVQGLGFRV